MNSLHIASCILLAGAVACGAVAGEQVVTEADLRVKGAVDYQGTWNGSAEISHVFFDSYMHEGAVVLEATRGQLTYVLWDYPMVWHRRDSSSPLGYVERYDDLPRQEIGSGQWEGGFRLIQPDLPLIHMIEFDGPWKPEITGDVRLQIAPGSSNLGVIANSMRDPSILSRDLRGGLVSFHKPPELTYDGAFSALLYGGTFHAFGSVNETFQTGRENETVEDPAEWTRTGIVHRYVLAVAGTATIRFTDGEASGWRFLTQHLQGNLDGDISLDNSYGQGTVNGTELPSRQHLFQAIGSFMVDGDYHGRPAHWTISGDADFVAVDANSVAGHRPSQLPAIGIAAATGALGLVGLLWMMFSETGRSFLAFLVGRHEATLHSSRTRTDMLRLVSLQPGITATQLARATGVTPQTADFHLHKMLSRFAVIDIVKVGNSKHFVPNTDTYKHIPSSRIRRDGNPEEHIEMRPILALLNDPTRRTMHEVLQRSGPLTLKQLKDQWPGSAPDNSVLHRHATRMAQAGILEAERVERSIQYRAVLDMDAAFREQTFKFLTVHRVGDRGYRHVYLAVVDGASREDEIVCAATMLGAKAARARQALRDLYAHGYLNRQDGEYTLNRTGVFANVDVDRLRRTQAR